jgi:hypothetical protein
MSLSSLLSVELLSSLGFPGRDHHFGAGQQTRSVPVLNPRELDSVLLALAVEVERRYLASTDYVFDT